MHGVVFLQDLAVVMIVAGLVTILFHRFKQPVVLGYIVAGVIIGPHTPPYPLIHEEETIRTLSDLGVILLMFSLGLEFSLRKLKQVGGSALIAALLEIVLMVWVGYQMGRWFGWSTMDNLFLGAMLSISSTTIIVKALAELGKSKESFAQLIFGILILEDILAIAMLALLSGIAMTGSLHLSDVGMTLGKLSIFLVASLVVGLLAVPRLLASVAGFRSNEMLLVTVLGLCFGFALLAAKLGYSVALGAFLIGAVIAESREVHRIEHLIEPVRDMFSAIFFVTIGLMIDPRQLAEYWVPILLLTVAVVIGKVVTCSVGTFLGGYDTRNSLRVGMGLAQIGEFSFIIASLGLTLHVTSPFLYPIAVAVSALTTLLTPYLIRGADGCVKQWERVAPAPLLGLLEAYTQWVTQLLARPSTFAAKLIRQWSLQMLLNLALIAAVFIAFAFLAEHPPGLLQRLTPNVDWMKSLLWLLAVVTSLPMVIATSRKLRALGMLVVETQSTDGATQGRFTALRMALAQLIPVFGIALLCIFMILLSSTLLTTIKVFLILAVVAGLIGWALQRSFVRVYSKAQVALQETLAQSPTPLTATATDATPNRSLTTLLREAELKSLELPVGVPSLGKRVRELQVRTISGASIVGIERGGTNLINPGPEEELRSGDTVVLLGSAEQLRAAEQLLLGR